jgi:ATP-dependent DNA helicase RecQ
MWRVSGGQLAEGASIDLDGLPPGFGGRSATALLDGLQRRQFLEWRHVTGGPRLTDPRTSLERYAIDWTTLERRRRADLAKLDAMQQYAYTQGCRRGFVLRYFGDPAARATCGGCDNCLQTHVVVKRRSSRGEAPPATRRAGVSSDRRRSRNGQESDVEVSLDPAGNELLSRLRALRSSIARTERVPSYVVFADRTLIEMAARRPKSLDAMGTIRGVGPVKLERYGERFLQLVRSTDETEAA